MEFVGLNWSTVTIIIFLTTFVFLLGHFLWKLCEVYTSRKGCVEISRLCYGWQLVHEPGWIRTASSIALYLMSVVRCPVGILNKNFILYFKF
jgi:hypothetical protein